MPELHQTKAIEKLVPVSWKIKCVASRNKMWSLLSSNPVERNCEGFKSARSFLFPLNYQITCGGKCIRCLSLFLDQQIVSVQKIRCLSCAW